MFEVFKVLAAALVHDSTSSEQPGNVENNLG